MSAKSNSVDFKYLSDKKMKRGEQELLEETKSWTQSNKKEKAERAQRELESKAMKAMKKRVVPDHREKTSWRKKAFGFAVIFAMCGAGLFSFCSALYDFLRSPAITRIDIQDTPKLKAILFGGEPWLLYCVDNQTADYKLPKVLEDSASSLWSSYGLSMGVLNCWEAMESGRSISQRFKLKKSPPLTLVVANGNPPRPLDLVGISKSEVLEKRIKPALTLEVQRIDQLRHWKPSCTSRKTCIIIGYKHPAQRDTALSFVKPIVDAHRVSRFVTLDTSFWSLKLDEKVLMTRPPRLDGKQKGAEILCLTRDGGGEGANVTYGGLFLTVMSASSVKSFVEDCEARLGVMPMPKAPQIQAKGSNKKPKVIKATAPGSKPKAEPKPKPKPKSRKQDFVGSRAKLEEQEEADALFEAIDEGEEPPADAPTSDGDDDDEEGSEEDEDGEAGADDEEVEL